MTESRILLGVIGRAHGVRGLVRVTSHTADPTALTAYGPLTDARGRRFALRWRGEGIAEIAEVIDGDAVKVTDRTGAERLTNTQLFIDRSQLPAPDEDEFYLADLIGLAAIDPSGLPLGLVTVVHDYGAGTSLEIERPGAPAVLVPFTRVCVPQVDISGGRVVVVVPDMAPVGLAEPGPAPLREADRQPAADTTGTRRADRGSDPGRDDPGCNDPGRDDPGRYAPGCDDPGCNDPGQTRARTSRPPSSAGPRTLEARP